MRKSIIAVAALLAAAPAIAQPDYDDAPAYADDYVEDERDYGPGSAVPVLDPRSIGAMASVMDRLVGAVMDLPIGGIAQAIDPYGRSEFGPGATVRDMAERDDPYAEERIRSGIQGATRGVGVMSEAIARMMPVLERTIVDVSRSMDQAIQEAAPRRPY